MNQINKCITITLLVVLPTIAGAILGEHLKIAWLALVCIIAGIGLALLYLYLNSKFVHVDKDIHSVEKQINELREKIGTGLGNRLSVCNKII